MFNNIDKQLSILSIQLSFCLVHYCDAIFNDCPFWWLIVKDKEKWETEEARTSPFQWYIKTAAKFLQTSKDSLLCHQGSLNLGNDMDNHYCDAIFNDCPFTRAQFIEKWETEEGTTSSRQCYIKTVAKLLLK